MYAHARAPVRIGIVGGGTDLPAWTRDRVGYCLSLAVATYAHAVAMDRPDKRVVASYRRLDEAPSATEIANGLIRESALVHGFVDGFEVHTLSQVTSLGSGLGVSSSIAVALAATFSRLDVMRKGGNVEPRWQDGGEVAWRAAVAKHAWEVEIDRLLRPIGRQDHMAATYGGLRLYRFEQDGASVERSFSEEDAAWVARHLLLVRLREGHDSYVILSRVKSSNQLQAAYDAVAVGMDAIQARDPRILGQALSIGLSSKMLIPGAVPASVREVIGEISRCQGVYGCKVAGAGGGGHLIVACEPEAADAIRVAVELPVSEVAPDLEGVVSEGRP